MQFGHLKRRDLIALLGSAAVACPRAARAQQPAPLPVIGFLDAGSAAERTVQVAELVINLNTARAIGLTVPATPLATANEVIE